MKYQVKIKGFKAEFDLGEAGVFRASALEISYEDRAIEFQGFWVKDGGILPANLSTLLLDGVIGDGEIGIGEEWIIEETLIP